MNFDYARKRLESPLQLKVLEDVSGSQDIVLSGTRLGDNTKLLVATSRTYQEKIMFKKTIVLSAITAALLFANSSAVAEDQDRTRLHDPDESVLQIKDQDRTRDRTQDRLQDQTHETVYGSQLMTEQERNQYRHQMRTAKTDEERAQIRAEHHERMQARAKERGVTLPDDPPARGSGMGVGRPMGGGMGAGMGAGRR
jgi:hypothetical protein